MRRRAEAAIIGAGLAAFAAGAAGAEERVPIQGGWVVAGDLLGRCNSKEPGPASWCDGFIAGVMEAHNTDVLFGGAKPAYCAPENVKNLQDFKAAVTSYIRRTPATHERYAGSVALLALRTSYPCDGDQPQQEQAGALKRRAPPRRP